VFKSTIVHDPFLALEVLIWSKEAGHSNPTNYYNSLLKSLSTSKVQTFVHQVSLSKFAWKVYRTMLRHGVPPNIVTFNLLARNSIHLNSWETCADFLTEIRRRKLQPNSFIYTTLLSCLTRKDAAEWNESKTLADIERLLCELKGDHVIPTLPFYNTLFHFLIKSAPLYESSLTTLDKFYQRWGMTPDLISYTICLGRSLCQRDTTESLAILKRISESKATTNLEIYRIGASLFPTNVLLNHAILNLKLHLSNISSASPWVISHFLFQAQKLLSSQDFTNVLQSLASYTGEYVDGVIVSLSIQNMLRNNKWKDALNSLESLLDNVRAHDNKPSAFRISPHFLSLYVSILKSHFFVITHSPTHLDRLEQYLDCCIDHLDSILAHQILQLLDICDEQNDPFIIQKSQSLSRFLAPHHVPYPDKSFVIAVVDYWKNKNRIVQVLEWEKYISTL
jgi:hypothetical protein